MPKIETIYEIQSQSTYMIELKVLQNIEDACDEFFTKEEIEEMGLRLHGGSQYFDDRITTALVEVKQTIKPGKKSAIIKDAELIDALKHNYRSCGYYLENTRRVGNRLFYYPQGTKALQLVPSFKNWKTLVINGQRLLNNVYKTSLDINLTNSDRVKTIELLRKVFTWDEFETYWADKKRCYYPPDAEDIVWLKTMWEDAETIPKVSSN